MSKETQTATESAATTVTLQKNGMATAVVVDIAKLPAAIINHLVAFGLQEKASNTLASAKKMELTGEQRAERVQAMIDSLMAGEWSARVASAAGMSPLEAETARLVYEQSKAIVAAQCTKPDDGFPRSKTAWLEGTYTVTESGDELTGGDVLAKVQGNEAIMAKINAQATANVKAKADAAKAREAVAIAL